MRGQVNFLILLAVAGMLAAWLGERKFKAGVWLAGAVAIKVFPVFLFVIPLWRRDWRMLAGGAVGSALLLGAVPLTVLGLDRTVESYRQLVGRVLMPGLTHHGTDDSRATELTNITGTGSQSFVAVLHNTLHPDRETRPDHAAAWVRASGMAAAGLLTLAVLWLGRRNMAWTGQANGQRCMTAWGLLIMAMLFTSPVCHMHYFCLFLPLVMAVNESLPEDDNGRKAWVALGWVFIAGYVLPHLPGLSLLRDLGLPMYVAIGLLASGVVVLTRQERVRAAIGAQDLGLRKAA
jgi:hypothetical protein